VYTTPSTKALLAAYETALKREHAPDPKLLKSCASKVGAMIYAAPAARFECAYSIGICVRCLTFPTPEMDELADRIICYMAQYPDGGMTYDGSTPGSDTFKCFSDSDCLVHSSLDHGLVCRVWQRDGGLREQALALNCAFVHRGRNHGGLACGSMQRSSSFGAFCVRWAWQWMNPRCSTWTGRRGASQGPQELPTQPPH
jgi:hypothetical protein